MSHRQIRQFCRLDTEGQNILRSAMTECGLSARAHDKVLRVARTIADLEGCEAIKSHHLNEAVNLPDAGPAILDVEGRVEGRGMRIG